MKRPTTEGLQNAFNIIAYASLKENGEPTNAANIDAEAARIERCVEYHYRTDKQVELDYPQFASKFLQENMQEIIHGDKYFGFYLDDVSDVTEDKQFYMDNASILV